MNSRGRGSSLTRPAWMHTPRPPQLHGVPQPSSRTEGRGAPTSQSTGSVSAATSSDWTRAVTDQGKTYWYSRSTGRTTWTDPTSLSGSVSDADGGAPLGESSWREVRLEDGRVYYYNAVSKQTRWDRPQDFSTLSPAPSASTTAVPSQLEQAISASKPPTTVKAQVEASNNLLPDVSALSPQASLPEGWAENHTPDGRLYFYHAATRETRWDRPSANDSKSLPSATYSAAPSPKRPAPSSPESAPERKDSSQWLQHQTPDGRVYYYNTVTRKTSWTQPNDVINVDEGSKSQVQKRARTASPIAPRPRERIPRQPSRKEQPGTVRRPRDPDGKPLSDRAAERYYINRAETRRKSRSDSQLTSQSLITRDAPIEKRINEFYSMLSDYGIQSTSSWLETMAKCAEDQRYNVLDSYGARKNAWKNFCQKRERIVRRTAIADTRKKATDLLAVMERLFSSEPYNVRTLSQCKPDSVRTFESDPCYSAIGESDRSLLIRTFFATRERRGIHERKVRRDEALQKMTDAMHQKIDSSLRTDEPKVVLKAETDDTLTLSDVGNGNNSKDITSAGTGFFTDRTSFRELERYLLSLPDAEYVNHDDVTGLVRKVRHHIDYLVERKRAREREIRKRVQQENRSRFRTGILEMLLDGRLPFTARWKEISELVSKQDFAKPESELGSRPSSLFDRGMSMFEERVQSHRDKFKQLLKEASFEVTQETTVDKLAEIERISLFMDGLERPIVEALLVDRQRKENKRRQKERERLSSELESKLRISEISSDLTFEKLKEEWKDDAIYVHLLAIGGEEAVRHVYSEYTSWKKNREERKKRSLELEHLPRLNSEGLLDGNDRGKRIRRSYGSHGSIPFANSQNEAGMRRPVIPREEENGWTAVVSEKVNMTEEEKLEEKKRLKRQILEARDSKESLTNSHA